VVFDNGSFGNVLRDQKQSYGGRVIGAELANPDFVRLAERFGVAASRADSPETLWTTLDRALAAGQPALIAVEVPRGSEASPWPFLHPAPYG
jgi:acetolactate synthase-1/2/3 large subunit